MHWKAKLLSHAETTIDTSCLHGPSDLPMASTPRTPLCARNNSPHKQIPHIGHHPVTLPSPPQSLLRHDVSDAWTLSPSSAFSSPRSSLSSPRSSLSSPLSPTDSLGSKASPCTPTSPERWSSLTVPLKKRWPRTSDQNIVVTDVTCNHVTVTFMESATDEGFFSKNYDK